jgi:DNA (cytosine-5)-methyltransferase 1
MNAAPTLIDFFCCEGGASRGYADAGFTVVGVDMFPQPRYPFPFLQMDALEALRRLRDGEWLTFTAPNGTPVFVHRSGVHATAGSPPCQARTIAQKIQGREHPLLIAPTRELFIELGLPYAIENVVPEDETVDPLIDPVLLCGEMFEIETYRHRLFESNVPLEIPEHPKHLARTTKMGRPPVPGEYMHIVGNFSGVERARRIMGMAWASRDGLREAIPPVYAEYIGKQLLAHIERERVSA